MGLQAYASSRWYAGIVERSQIPLLSKTVQSRESLSCLPVWIVCQLRFWVVDE